jgi:hypothetical protein
MKATTRMVRQLVLVLVLLVALAATAGASSRTPVTLTVTTLVIGGTGTFVADGVVCPDGTTSDVAFTTGGGNVAIYHSDKTFVCADGSGTFTIQLTASRYAGVPGTTGTWKVATGTGAYESLKGSGKLVGTDLPGGGITDVFTGKVSL